MVRPTEIMLTAEIVTIEKLASKDMKNCQNWTLNVFFFFGQTKMTHIELIAESLPSFLTSVIISLLFSLS